MKKTKAFFILFVLFLYMNIGCGAKQSNSLFTGGLITYEEHLCEYDLDDVSIMKGEYASTKALLNKALEVMLNVESKKKCKSDIHRFSESVDKWLDVKCNLLNCKIT